MLFLPKGDPSAQDPTACIYLDARLAQYVSAFVWLGDTSMGAEGPWVRMKANGNSYHRRNHCTDRCVGLRHNRDSSKLRDDRQSQRETAGRPEVGMAWLVSIQVPTTQAKIQEALSRRPPAIEGPHSYGGDVCVFAHLCLGVWTLCEMNFGVSRSATPFGAAFYFPTPDCSGFLNTSKTPHRPLDIRVFLRYR
jgi:hypothetical protein